MGETTHIQWCDKTFNPWIGCTKISPACDNCYAERYGARFGVEWGPGKPRRLTADSTWRRVLTWIRKAAGLPTPPRVFCSLCDPFDPEVPLEWRRRLAVLVINTPHLRWMLLTKRPAEARDHGLNGSGIKAVAGSMSYVWLGVTVENQRLDGRIDIAAEAQRRYGFGGLFVSAEPLLGPLDLSEHISAHRVDTLVDLVIVGGESGPNARPMNPAWARSLRDQCSLHDVPFCVKQWGEWAPNCLCGRDEICRTIERPAPGSRGVMFRCGKVAAGRELDGVIYDG